MLYDELKTGHDDWLEKKRFGITRNAWMMVIFAIIVIGFFSFSFWRWMTN